MLPLSGPRLPDSAESLAQSLRDGLARRSIAARDVAASGAWPMLDALRIDLTGSSLTRAQRMPAARCEGERKLDVADFSIIARPLQVENTPIDLALRATRAAFVFSQTSDADPVLALVDAADGEVVLEVRRDALEALLHSLAKEAAEPHGVDVRKTRIELAARGPRELNFRAEVTAKMFIATAAVSLSGELAIDDQLNARLSNLRFGGEGMIANVAGGFIRPHLEKLEGRTLPLMAFSLGGITLRDVQVQGGDSLRLSAQFGGQSSLRAIS